MDATTIGLIIGVILVIVTIILILSGAGKEKAKIEEPQISRVEPVAPAAPPVSPPPPTEILEPEHFEPVIPEAPPAVAQAAAEVPEMGHIETAVPEAPPVFAQAAAEVPQLEPVEPAIPEDFSAVKQAAAAVPEAGKADDLTLIEGIGPKIAGLLNLHGITSFAQLASADLPALEKMLQENGLQFIKPASWIEQGRLAAEGKMDELKALQDRLIGGR